MRQFSPPGRRPGRPNGSPTGPAGWPGSPGGGPFSGAGSSARRTALMAVAAVLAALLLLGAVRGGGRGPQPALAATARHPIEAAATALARKGGGQAGAAVPAATALPALSTLGAAPAGLPPLFLFVGILSGRGYRHRRLAVRDSWARGTQNEPESAAKFILSEDEATPQVRIGGVFPLGVGWWGEGASAPSRAVHCAWAVDGIACGLAVRGCGPCGRRPRIASPGVLGFRRRPRRRPHAWPASGR
jgi:hypothetical protein